MRIAHNFISVAFAIAVPLAVYLVNGSVGYEFIALGAVVGLAYWYWGPLAL